MRYEVERRGLHQSDLGHAALATLGTLLIVLGAFFNFLQNGIQLVGAGAIITLIFSASKFYSDRREMRSRGIQERINKLQPTVYNPVITWAIQALDTITAKNPDEFVFYDCSAPKPSHTRGICSLGRSATQKSGPTNRFRYSMSTETPQVHFVMNTV